MALALGACNGVGYSPDVLTAEGTLLDAEGQPLATAPVDQYSIFFRISPTLEIVYDFLDDLDDTWGGIAADLTGLFRIGSPDLQLGYSYDTDRQVCYDTCSGYSDSCTDYWVEGSCYWVETGCYTDKDGNYYCDGYNDCSGGYWETSCSSYCSSYVTDCYWVTDTRWVGLNVNDVQSARTEILMSDSEGTSYLMTGVPSESRRRPQECAGESCTTFNEWIQRDSFQTPFAQIGASAEGSTGLQLSPKARLSRPAQVTRIGVMEQDRLTDAQMTSLRELRAHLGIVDSQIRGRH